MKKQPSKAIAQHGGKIELDENGEEKKCFICGATTNLVRTECCGKWICDDEDEYVLFSYARNSCHRNHRRFTLCAYTMTTGTRATGRLVRNAARWRNLKWSPGLARTNTTGRRCRIRPSSNLRGATTAARLSSCPKAATPTARKATRARSVWASIPQGMPRSSTRCGKTRRSSSSLNCAARKSSA